LPKARREVKVSSKCANLRKMARNKSPGSDLEKGEGPTATSSENTGDSNETATKSSEILEESRGNQLVVDDKLRNHIKSIDGSNVGSVAVLSFRALQLYRIAALQRELVGMQNEVMQGRTKSGDDIDKLLQKYG
jgi:hypothetical protein